MKKTLFTVFLCALCIGTASTATAAITTGIIDPENSGDHYAQFVRDRKGESVQINFGKFSTVPSANISISDDGIRGFAWSEMDGYIVMNCEDTTSGCSTANENFKVSIAEDGVLSGYAWGRKTGWINFGPFTNNDTSQVSIGSDGAFNGFAWSQRIGWIAFDCSDPNSCVKTDYIPQIYRENDTSGDNRGGAIGGYPQITLPYVQNSTSGTTSGQPTNPEITNPTEPTSPVGTIEVEGKPVPIPSRTTLPDRESKTTISSPDFIKKIFNKDVFEKIKPTIGIFIKKSEPILFLLALLLISTFLKRLFR